MKLDRAWRGDLRTTASVAGISRAARPTVEALQSGTAVIASACAGNVGLLGPDYPGLFPVGDMASARALLLRAEGEPSFRRRLLAAAARRAKLFTPAREGRSLRRLVHNSLKNKQSLQR